ncbi:MAG: 50S ribosomal protein L4, partial [Elusimicrobia bacterium]|nr:50S ribosomal protein L4 [Elusimicrobiota bacterium]
QESGSVQLDDAIVSVKGSKSVLHEYTVAYMSNQRSGQHQVKTRAEVSGGGLKPWKQKHTGRARSGSTRSPLWRHGGIIFGPVHRDYTIELPKKKKQLAFRMAVKDLVEENRLQVVDPIQVSEQKTKNVAAVYKKWQAPTDSILLVDKIDAAFNKVSRNIANVCVVDVSSFNAFDAMRARRVFITRPALEILNQRLGASAASQEQEQ